MIEDDGTHEHPPGDPSGSSLHYDFAKFLTTLSLLALGGVLTLVEKLDKALAKPPIIGFVAACVVLAGVCALSAASNIAGVAAGKRRRAAPRTMLMAAMGLLGMGAGGFVVLWWKSL